MDRTARPADDVWIHPCVEVRRSGVAGEGLFATTRLDADVVVIRLGGRLVSTAELHHLFAAAADGDYIDTVAVGDDTHIVLPPGTAAHYGNHSCEPNMWSVGAYELVTRRPVDPGDELTIDYGTISDDAAFRMECTCGAASCRGVITGLDWRRADLQRRYAHHWPPGLQRRIDSSARPSE
jgi:hypothetical protein